MDVKVGRMKEAYISFCNRGYVSPEYFCDRQQESERLIRENREWQQPGPELCPQDGRKLVEIDKMRLKNRWILACLINKNWWKMEEGARRVGKSTLAEEFARNEYESYILIGFAIAPTEVRELFNDISDLNYIFLRL